MQLLCGAALVSTAAFAAVFFNRKMKRHDFYRFLINFIYPNICPCCGKIIGYNDAFCVECAETFEASTASVKIEYADDFAAFCVYDGNASRLVTHFKNDPCGNSAYAFAYGIFRAVSEKDLAKYVDEIVYIPMTRADYDRRGYNQTELIARELHFMMNVPYQNALVKRRRTRHQKELSGEERKRNVTGVFAAAEGLRFDGKSVLIIDDVCTTGSTLSDAARALREAGAERVFAAAFAKTQILPRNS